MWMAVETKKGTWQSNIKAWLGVFYFFCNQPQLSSLANAILTNPNSKL